MRLPFRHTSFCSRALCRREGFTQAKRFALRRAITRLSVRRDLRDRGTNVSRWLPARCLCSRSAARWPGKNDPLRRRLCISAMIRRCSGCVRCALRCPAAARLRAMRDRRRRRASSRCGSGLLAPGFFGGVELGEILVESRLIVVDEERTRFGVVTALKIRLRLPAACCRREADRVRESLACRRHDLRKPIPRRVVFLLTERHFPEHVNRPSRAVVPLSRRSREQLFPDLHRFGGVPLIVRILGRTAMIVREFARKLDRRRWAAG